MPAYVPPHLRSQNGSVPMTNGYSNGNNGFGDNKTNERWANVEEGDENLGAGGGGGEVKKSAYVPPGARNKQNGDSVSFIRDMMNDYETANSGGWGNAVPAPTGHEVGAGNETDLTEARVHGDGEIPAPFTSFNSCQFPKPIMASIFALGFAAPTPIQAYCWPVASAGRDLIGIAKTGSGKTLAFLLPPFTTFLGKKPGYGPTMMVMAPTRELACQIQLEADKFGRRIGLHSVCVYGGAPRGPQLREMRNGTHLVVGTPGRLNDFREGGQLNLSCCSFLVLDEADRMLDMGFSEDVSMIAGRVQPKRQVLFFSATWGGAVQELAQGLCRQGSKPVRISYGQSGAAGGGSVGGSEAAQHQAREGITQQVVVVDHEGDGDKHWESQAAEKQTLLDKHLTSVLEASEEHKVLVFVSQKKFADDLSARLQKHGFGADAMHGGKSQDYRLWVLDQFRKGKLRVLVCTDVLGRGIDIPDVSHVVIHEMGEIEDYVHRIGRTARGRHGKGHALVFFEYWEGASNLAAELAKVLAASKQHVPEALLRIAEEVANGKRKIRREETGRQWGSAQGGTWRQSKW